MLQYYLQIYLILMLHIISQVNHSLSQENGFSKTELFPKEKCESVLINCTCHDLRIAAAIVCNNVTDFFHITRTLESDDIFEVNTTYEITFSDVTYLPARLLQGLIVYRIILDDSDAVVDENIFEGALYVKRCLVRRSSIKIIPNFRIVKDSIKVINIDSSQLASLEGENLQNLTMLKKLSFVNNSIRYIDPDVFQGTENIIILDLSHNLLTSIPPKLLDPMKNLTKFVVSSNNLLHVDNLFSVTHPQFIYLEFNNITDADSVLQPNMVNLETLVLASNPIKKISVHSFNGKIPRARFLYLDHCEIEEFNVEHYRDLSNLAALDLSYNYIKEVSNQTIAIGSNLELDLIGNQIEKFDAEISASLKRLYLSANKLQSLDTTLQRTQIVEVQIARNQIKYLTDQDFRSVHATSNLELQENKIARIDTDTFKSIRNDLHYLDLSSNRITSLNGSVMFLSQLKLLNLTDNLIQTFQKDEFTGLNELSELYLQHNRIKALVHLDQLRQLQYLVITHNNLEVIRPDQVPKNLRFMYLADNPFKCDCQFQPFILWLNASDSPTTDVDLCFEADVTTNLHKQLKCPEMCTCECIKDGNLYYMSIDCSSKNLSSLPQEFVNKFKRKEDNATITSVSLHSLVMEQSIFPSIHIQDRVLAVNLENNILESLKADQLPSNLIQLYLSNNRLKWLPMSAIYKQLNLKQVSLSGNPWNCDCNALKFKRWLTSKYDIIQDINNTRCETKGKGRNNLDGRVIWTLSDLDICPPNIGLIVSVSIGVLIFLSLCLVLKILYIKYELNIKVFLYSHGFTFVKEEDLDYDKTFDAFLSFSHQDADFVTKEIISVIENKHPNIRLCIHYRHFLPGEFIHDNIIFAVQNSKRTVLILSRNFLESEWCLMEFRAAHIQALEDKVHRIIVIKVGDLPKDIDPSIKVYLDSTTYLTWGDKYFWNNLLYVLPTSNSIRNPIPKNKTDNKIV